MQRRDPHCRCSASRCGSGRQLDRSMIALDGTDNKSRLGANAILAVSLASRQGARGVTRTAAVCGARPQERPTVPVADDEHHQRRRACRQQRGHPGIHDPAGQCAEFRRSLRYGVEVFHALKSVLKAGAEHRGRRRRRIRAGPAAPMRPRSDTIGGDREGAGYTLGREIFLGLDVASSEFFADGATTSSPRSRRSRRPGSRTISRTSSRAIRSSRSRMAWRKATGTVGGS